MNVVLRVLAAIAGRVLPNPPIPPHFPVSSAVGLSADVSAPSTPRCVAADSPAVPTPHPGTAGQPACHHVMCAQVYGGARCLDPVGVCIDFRDGHQTVLQNLYKAAHATSLSGSCFTKVSCAKTGTS